MATSTSDIAIRLATFEDIGQLRLIDAASVRALARGHDSRRHIDAWAGYAEAPAFIDFVLKPLIVLATVDRHPIGFCGVEPTGHIASLYVHPDHARRGIGTALLREALDRCATPTRGHWFAEASLLSRPVFDRVGFAQAGVEQSDRAGIRFERFLMRREWASRRFDDARGQVLTNGWRG